MTTQSQEFAEFEGIEVLNINEDEEMDEIECENLVKKAIMQYEGDFKG